MPLVSTQPLINLIQTPEFYLASHPLTYWSKGLTLVSTKLESSDLNYGWTRRKSNISLWCMSNWASKKVQNGCLLIQRKLFLSLMSF